jgi:hypothetical protein
MNARLAFTDYDLLYLYSLSRVLHHLSENLLEAFSPDKNRFQAIMGKFLDGSKSQSWPPDSSPSSASYDPLDAGYEEWFLGRLAWGATVRMPMIQVTAIAPRLAENWINGQ